MEQSLQKVLIGRKIVDGKLLPAEVNITAFNITQYNFTMQPTLAQEVARHNIRVNVICPGYHETPLTPPEAKVAFDAEMIPHIPLRRAAKSEEIKGLAVWLASDASSYVTGQILVQDGGVHA